MNENPNPAPDREAAIFEAALQLPPEQRAAHIRNACGDDTLLRERVEALLKAHEGVGDFLEDGAVPSTKKTIVLSLPPEEKPGEKIGRYKILQKIGEGGCGVVYMAEQEVPVRRRVALKVIKLGMDTKQVIARFEAERQALAMMDHPNIAKVLDAGGTETGRPFFVMELVRGIRITDYCDQNKLSTEERLNLFVQVCNAIQHAHQKGIIHRDIKPSNILVTLHDGVPVPKVIDFGIAKATQGRLTDQTLFTAFEQFIGTPAYMSPEQAEMSGLDIDTRCDIYALGVLLYELLTGMTPFDAKALVASGLDKMRQTIREQEPERPSTRLNTMLHADLTEAANRRHTDAPRLIHLLKGDLDWIVMKALEKDRTRRFETANGLAMDIQRYLTNEPVLARPPSTVYRFQKMVRRNKTVFIAAGAGVGALVLGLALSLYMFIQERAARERAVAAEKEQARLREQAEEHAGFAAKLTQAGLLLTRDQYDEAERLVNEVPAFSTMVPLFNVFGLIHARRAEWDRAITNYRKVTTLAPEDPMAYACLAPLLAYQNDVEGYTRLRAEALRRFTNDADIKIAQPLVAGCLLRPAGSPAEQDQISKLAEAFARQPATSGDAHQFEKALNEYRRGQFQAAMMLLESIPPADQRKDWNVAVFIKSLQAMAEYRLTRLDTAKTDLAQAMQMETRMRKAGWDNLGDSWPGWLFAQTLLREARTLMPDVTASAEVSESMPVWMTALIKAGFKISADQLEDKTWQVAVNDQPLTNLALLHGVPISRLSIMRTKVSDLNPLRGMPLISLQLADAPVSDLSPLQGMPIQYLQLTRTLVTDLSPLRELPLRDLKMTSCLGITNIDLLARITTLESIILPPNAQNIQALRALPKLNHIGFNYDSTSKGPDQTAENFWKDFDRKQPANKPAVTP